MTLIEVNNKNSRSNFQLLEETEEWAKNNIEGKYTIILDPNLEVDRKVTKIDLTREAAE